MTINSHGGPGKTRHLNVLPYCCANAGMRVIFIDAGRNDHRQPGQVARLYFAQSDVSQLNDIYGSESGDKLADAVRNNCNVWFPLKSGGPGHDL